MKPLSLLLAVALGLLTTVSAGPTTIECWLVEDAGKGALALTKRPAALLLRQGPRGPPPRPDLDPKLYFSVDDPTGALKAALQRYPPSAPAPHCEMSRFVPLPASASWASRLAPERSCPRALDGAWLMVSVSSSVFSLSSLLRLQPEPQQEPVLITMATVVLTVLTHTPTSRIRLGQDAMLDLSFTYMPPTPEAAVSLAPGPPPFGLEWRRQHQGNGQLLLAATPGLGEQVPAAQEGAVAFAAWDDVAEPWGPWTGNGTFWLPAVQPFQEGTYLATVHLPYLQGQVALELSVHKPPKVSLKPAPLVWAAPGESPPELLCLVSHFYPAEGLEVEWELRGGPEGGFQKAEGQRWLSGLSHHSDGSLSLSGHLQPPPATAKHHGARYVCRVHHPSLPVSGRSAEVTVEVAGLSGPSLEDGVGLFLSAFLLLGLIKALSWVVAYLTTCKDSKEKRASREVAANAGNARTPAGAQVGCFRSRPLGGACENPAWIRSTALVAWGGDAGGRGGKRKGREGPGAGGVVGGGVRKSREGDAVRDAVRDSVRRLGPETHSTSSPGPALPPPAPSRSEPEHRATLPVLVPPPHP
ncbi:tapasin [Ctenodactylus gundi]